MKRQKTTLKSYFETGDIPTQSQYENLIDSLRHLDDKIPLTDLDGQVVLADQVNNFSAEQGFTSIYVGGNATFDDETSFNASVEFTDHTIFESTTKFRDNLSAQFPLTPLDVANQSVGSILLGNNSAGAEAPTLAGKTNNNSPGLQFIAATRDASGTLADMIFNVRENNNTDFTSELNTIGFQFRRFGTPLVNIYRNGKQENLYGLEVSGEATFNSSTVFNDALTVTDGGIEIYGASSFENGLELTGSLNANSGINSHWHIKLKDNSWLWSQYSASHDELRLNANTAGGWDFYNQTQSEFANIRAKGADFTGLISADAGITIDQPDQFVNLRFNRNLHTSYTLSLADALGLTVTNLSNNVKEMQFTGLGNVNFNAQIVAKNSLKIDTGQYAYFGDANDLRISHNGSHSFVDNYTGDLKLRNSTAGGNMELSVNDSTSIEKTLIYLSGSSRYVSLRNDGNEKLKTVSDGIEVNQTISTPADTSLRILPNGAGDIYIGNPINGNSMYHYSTLDDGQHTTFTHNSFQSVFDSTHPAGFRFNKGIQVHGDVRTIGDFVSSDGTPGYSGSFTVGAYDITVKNGIITDVVNIS